MCRVGGRKRMKNNFLVTDERRVFAGRRQRKAQMNQNDGHDQNGHTADVNAFGTLGFHPERDEDQQPNHWTKGHTNNTKKWTKINEWNQ